MARWTKSAMTAAGIDTSFFTPYSTCSAATSSAACHTRSLELVLKMGNWHTTGSFFNHYLRRVKYFSCEKFHSPPCAYRCWNPVCTSQPHHIPADPAKVSASHSLLCHAQKIWSMRTRRKTPYLDLPPHQQGFDNSPTPALTHYLKISDTSSEVPSSPTPSLDSTISSVSDLLPPELERFDSRDLRLTPVRPQPQCCHRPNILPKNPFHHPVSHTTLNPAVPDNTSSVHHEVKAIAQADPGEHDKHAEPSTNTDDAVIFIKLTPPDPFACRKAVFMDAPVVHSPSPMEPHLQGLDYRCTGYQTFLCRP